MLLSTYLIIALAFSIIQMLIRFNYHDDKKEEEREDDRIFAEKGVNRSIERSSKVDQNIHVTSS